MFVAQPPTTEEILAGLDACAADFASQEDSDKHLILVTRLMRAVGAYIDAHPANLGAFRDETNIADFGFGIEVGLTIAQLAAAKEANIKTLQQSLPKLVLDKPEKL